MKVRTQQNFNRKTYETVFGISIMPDGGRRYCKYPIGHQDNQGLDARLITDEIARLLARVKWIKRIRFGCDTPGQIAEVERASALIDKYGYKGEYFLYCILMDFKESFARVNYWKSKSRRFLPHCQPFRDLNNPHQIIPQWQKDMAHWADRKEIYMSCDFKDFSPRKGFLCKEYFKML